jgi:SAM-dependent methyltransferase
LTVGRTWADAAGVQVDWVEADVEDLPYPAGCFDMVLSMIGAMFAPDHVRTAAELVRVCRPGGAIALANWTPDGYGGAFFGLLARYAAPPPAGTTPAMPATAWGPDHVRELLKGHVDDLSLLRRTLTLAFTGSAERLFEIYGTCFGPVLAIRAFLGGDLARLTAFDQELLDFLRRENVAFEDGSGLGRYQFDYLAVTAKRRP